MGGVHASPPQVVGNVQDAGEERQVEWKVVDEAVLDNNGHESKLN